MKKVSYHEGFDALIRNNGDTDVAVADFIKAMHGDEKISEKRAKTLKRNLIVCYWPAFNAYVNGADNQYVKYIPIVEANLGLNDVDLITDIAAKALPSEKKSNVKSRVRDLMHLFERLDVNTRNRNPRGHWVDFLERTLHELKSTDGRFRIIDLKPFVDSTEWISCRTSIEANARNPKNRIEKLGVGEFRLKNFAPATETTTTETEMTNENRMELKGRDAIIFKAFIELGGMDKLVFKNAIFKHANNAGAGIAKESTVSQVMGDLRKSGLVEALMNGRKYLGAWKVAKGITADMLPIVKGADADHQPTALIAETTTETKTETQEAQVSKKTRDPKGLARKLVLEVLTKNNGVMHNDDIFRELGGRVKRNNMTNALKDLFECGQIEQIDQVRHKIIKKRPSAFVGDDKPEASVKTKVVATDVSNQINEQHFAIHSENLARAQELLFNAGIAVRVL